MKQTILFLLTILCCYSCTRNSKDQYETLLSGKWVNVQQPLDTLEINREGDRIILFDNSLYLRTSLSSWLNQDDFKKELAGVNENKILVRAYKNKDEWFPYQFQWIEYPSSFEIQVQAIRPHISALYNLTYRKVQ